MENDRIRDRYEKAELSFRDAGIKHGCVITEEGKCNTEIRKGFGIVQDIFQKPTEYKETFVEVLIDG